MPTHPVFSDRWKSGEVTREGICTGTRIDDYHETPIMSTTLLGDRRSISINHHGVLYVLRTTRAGKLILTK